MPTEPTELPPADPLQAYLNRLVGRRRIPHVVLGVTSGDGTFAWSGAAGDADGAGTPMRADTPYFIASVTKLCIATLVLQMHERGQIELDTPMVDYLPSEVTAGLHVRRGVDLTGRITVHNLLGHTSGLSDYLEDRPRGGTSWYRRIADGADTTWSRSEALQRVRDELRPKFVPQDPYGQKVRARYSDTGFQLLIAIIEHVTGTSYGRALDEHLIRPLGLERTWLPGHRQPEQPMAAPARLFHKGKALNVPGVIASSNDLMSTVEDQLVLMKALVSGEVFDDPATRLLAIRRFNRIMYPLEYGLGMMRFRVNRMVAPGRDTVTLVGHSGATGSWLFHCPELDLHVAGTVDDIDARAVPYRLLPPVLRIVAG